MTVQVKTAAGTVAGVERGGVCAFLGIPYAAPPVGARRFRAPERPEPWDGVRDATAFGPSVPQTRMEEPIGSLFAATAAAGDDCLNLNVWTPDPGARGLPVFVWVHGGGFQVGAGSDPLYDGSAFARDGVVTVSLNYRMGVQGFLLLEGEPDSGNFGLLDQLLALEWVQENVAAFGGDPGNVTVGGESAGGMAVGALLAMPAARGLFRRATAQSGAGHNAIPLDVARAVAGCVAETLGVDPADADALRAAPLERLLAAELEAGERTNARDDPRFGELNLTSMPMAFQPVHGTAALPEPPLRAIRGGAAAGIDLLVGAVRDEMLGPLQVVPEAFGIEPGGDLPRELLTATAQLVFDGTAEQAVATYAANRPGASNLTLLAAVLTDWSFRIPAIRLAEAQAPHAAVYAYTLSWRGAGADGRWEAGHALDLPLLFETVETEVGRFLTGGSAPAQLVESMHGAWVEFVRSGVPGHRALPPWPAYDTARRATMQLDVESAVAEDPAAGERVLWEELL